MPYKNKKDYNRYMRERYAKLKGKTIDTSNTVMKTKPKPKPTFTYSKFNILHILNKTLRGKLSYQEYKILHDTIWKY